MESIEEQLRARILGHSTRCYRGGLSYAAMERAIMADVEVALAVRGRVEYAEGAAQGYADYIRGPASPNTWRATARERNPLPSRTRRVLREEPVPGELHPPLFRVRDGVLEWTPNPAGEVGGKRWHTYAAWYGGKSDTGNDWPRMRHALDLHDNPYRTEEVPVDESNPWPEVEP